MTEAPTRRMIHGDCLDVLPDIEAGSVDAVITDPPYGIGAPGTGDWDTALPSPAVWARMRRCLRPDAGVAVMSSRRLYHRVAVALEDAGYRVSDMLVWLYGTGRAAGRYRLRAAHDPIVLGTASQLLRLDVAHHRRARRQ